MAGGNLGDIVVTLGMDSRKWFDEAAKIGPSARGIGGKIRESLTPATVIGSLEGAFTAGIGGGIGEAVSSLGSAISAGVSGLGPWGMAIGTVGGILSAQLLPKLFDSKKATDEFTASIETNIAAVERSSRKAAERIDFQERLSDLSKKGTTGSITDAIHEKDVEAKKLRAEKVELEGALADAVFVAEKKGAIRNLDPAKRGFFNDLGLVTSDASLAVDSGIIGKEAATSIKKLFDRRTEIDRALTQNASDREQIALTRPEADNRADIAEIVRRAGQAQDVRDSDPLRAFQNNITRISGLMKDGFLDKDIGSRALTRIGKDFRDTLRPVDPTGSANVAAIGGTAAGFSSLQASLRQDRAQQDAMSQMQREHLQVAKDILAEVRKALDLPTPEQEVD